MKQDLTLLWFNLIDVYMMNVVDFMRNFNLELRLMFRLMDRVSDGIAPMLKCLEDHIIHAGLADMMLAAELITQVIWIIF